MRVVPVSQKTLNVLKKNDCEVQKELERRGAVKLELSSEDAVGIEAVDDSDAGCEWIAEKVVQALSIGFSPSHAFKLFDDEYFIEIIDLDIVLFGDEKAIARYKGRIIGTEGKSKEKIEELSGAFVSISDNVIGILGKYEQLRNAKEAVTRLLEGANHSSVYSFLEKKHKESSD